MSICEHTLENISLPYAPKIRGLSFRCFAGESDFPKMAEVIQGCKEVDQLERAESAEDIQRSYQHLVNSDPYEDRLFAEVHGETVGYSRVSWHEQSDGKRIYLHFGFLLPEWRHKGIGRAMMRYNQRRLRTIAARHPNHVPRFYESFAADTEHSAEALLRSDGYKPVRHFYRMLRPDLEDIPESPMPAGLQVRQVLPEHYELIRAASLEAFRDHWGFSEDMEPDIQEWLDDPNFNPDLWMVAWDGDQVAGMVLNYIDQKENEVYQRMRGWTENICVRRPWRRQGLAKALIARSLHLLKDIGMQEAALGVDTQNLSGALRLYERMGYQPDKRFTTYRKPLK
jgi:GNAT superfamily N-acetyltransferase